MSAGTIDVWAQHVTERFLAEPWLETLMRWTGMPRTPPALDQLLAAMDASDVDMALLAAWHGPMGTLISNDDVAAAVQAHPDRFRGLACVDLTEPMAAIREIRHRVAEGLCRRQGRALAVEPAS